VSLVRLARAVADVLVPARRQSAAAHAAWAETVMGEAGATSRIDRAGDTLAVGTSVDRLPRPGVMTAWLRTALRTPFPVSA